MFHKRLLSEFKDNKKLIAGMVVTQWIMLLANVILIMETANFIVCIFDRGDITEQTIRLLVTLFIVLIIRQIMLYSNSKLSFETSRQLKQRLRASIYEKLMRIGSGYRKTVTTAEVVQISTEGVEQLEIYFGKYIPQFFYSMLAPLTLFIIVGTMSMKVAVILLLCVPLIPASIIAVQKFAKKMLSKYWLTYTELGDSFLECLQGLTTLKIYQADEHYAKRMDEESEKFRKVTMQVLIMQLNSISIMDLVAYGGAGIGIILSILEFQREMIPLSQCFFIIMISAEFFLPLRLLGSFFHIAMNGNAAADKIFRLLDKTELEIEKMAGQIKDDTILFQRVSFSYEEKKETLRNVTIQAKRGMTALVGESGCGKSTIVSLIMKELITKQGNIQVGNSDLIQLSSDVLYKKVTRVRHNSYLFAGTVKENLLMGKPTATKEEMYQALEQVNLYEFVKKNGGLEMKIEEKAFNLSGGQKQRLALARALLHNTEIYIFDEATSNVDIESESDIMSVIKELAKVKTVILISHRLANVIEADNIYVMKNGQIIESGRHNELYKKAGYYYNLFQQQMILEQYSRGKEKSL